ncbi:hypothetical protein [Streptomyces bungoensis]|uniref:hypothetical protein n=1 Tax=Streptomyces bungoensis TaxID=285568 RepID=UPI00343441BD
MEPANPSILLLALAAMVITTLVLIRRRRHSLTEAGAAVGGTLSPVVVAWQSGLGVVPGPAFLAAICFMCAATLWCLLTGYATMLEVIIFNGVIGPMIVAILLA